MQHSRCTFLGLLLGPQVLTDQCADTPPCCCQLARLDGVLAGSSLMVGDLVRGVTCTNFVYPTQALFGASAPRRTIVLYGADNQKWPQVASCTTPYSPGNPSNSLSKPSMLRMSIPVKGTWSTCSPWYLILSRAL